MNSIQQTYITGKLLIAMPHMPDDRFKNSVIFIYNHDAEGAFGLILNKPLKKINLNELSEDLGLKKIKDNDYNLDIFLGGPVDITKGFVLHSNDYTEETTQSITPDIKLSTSTNVLENMGKQENPGSKIVLFGYASWEAGQLEQEIADNEWLIADASKKFIFDCESSKKWNKSISNLGVNVTYLASFGGNA
ncbi:YqgE/AlgH family protein [Pelagibacterales bacterium]|jgi:putative transcriptional regulator|nr:YqgE/AlgH family protein [Pelagibacterales bacterium]MDA9137450.1 YqgE/AlgH family protein [Pelagibacterales bacterium]MDB9985929.1 YqgE/AlgH family protein [Pelagibacterales bacterium]|tara:strand:+ start:897 stop:1469 length:573 start_codon:yes stop_codon:yes gene_type:complete